MIPTPRLKGAISTLERAKRPILVTHQRPDGDAIGSALGLGLLLETLGANVQLACADPVPGRYRFLAGSERFTTDPDFKDADLLVMLDCPKDDMSALDIPQVLRRMPVVDIDHHPRTAPPRDRRLAVYDHTASSAAEMVYVLAQDAGWLIDRIAATALLTGIVTDTSAFINATTTADTYRAASALLRRGANLKAIIQHCFYHSSVPKLQLWGRAMSRIRQHPQSAGVVSTVLTAEDLKECGADREDIEGLVNFLNSIPGVPALILLTDLGRGEIKGSFRTRNEAIDVNKLAGVLGGGGHKQAAGFTIPGRLVKNANETWSVLPPA
ncbi:MAG: bifunctional oligoribonuclease/PAP phosphatase NrnA [bacterium]|nr:bifunctional oligoribonuclease/PAP phosphatase NrnA [bacterium]MDZ4248007.1 bifunctional oligoribonuclease/PAP phosphatase NrnA [Patescibacteria group bacterium]